MKRNMKKVVCLLMSAALIISVLTGCKAKEVKTGASDGSGGKLKVVATIFPYYDFIREIAGDKVDLTMLVPKGMDTHSFEPTAKDMITIQNADLFIYNGGNMESWVPKVLQAAEGKEKSVCMMDCVDVVEEELVEGMQEEEEEAETGDAGKNEEEVEYDEHIWTAPCNSEKIVEKIASLLEENDPANSAVYKANAASYVKKLKDLDERFKEVVKGSKRQLFVFGDKFPMRYFADAYHLDYYAAFPGCSTDTEPSASTIAYLTDKVKAEKVPVVFCIELSSGKVADTICEATGAKKLTFYTCHNVTQAQFDEGYTYLTMMEKNIASLKAALN